MSYVNFKEERYVLKGEINKRKKNNERIYNGIIKNKIKLREYRPSNKYSYKKILDKTIGYKGIVEEGEFTEISNIDILATKFINCSFSNVKFNNCRFIGCTFEECNFEGGGVIFDSCTFIKESSEKHPSLNIKDNLGCSFYKCNLYIKFIHTDLSYLILEDSLIKNTNFEVSIMKNLIISNCELNKIEIVDCDMSGFKTLNTYIIDLEFNDDYITKFDTKTFFDKIKYIRKNKQEYEGIYVIYQNLAQVFKENNLQSNFGEYYYLGKCTERKCEKLIPKIGSWIYWSVCGYGERPWFCIISSLVIMMIFAILYLITGMELDGKIIVYNLKSIDTWSLKLLLLDFNEAINLSIGMFAGVGVNNAQPIALNYIIANIQMLVGVVMMGVGIGTLTRKVIR